MYQRFVSKAGGGVSPAAPNMLVKVTEVYKTPHELRLPCGLKIMTVVSVPSTLT